MSVTAKPAASAPVQRAGAPAASGASISPASAGTVTTAIPAEPVSNPASNPASNIADCTVSDSNPDGSAFITFYARPDIMRRLRHRAGNVPLGKYLWENLLKRALDSHVY